MALENWANRDEFELVNEDGFVYKRRRRSHLDPTVSTAPQLPDPAVEENRRERKKRALMKLKKKYQMEIQQWELLSKTLNEMQQNAKTQQLKLQESATMSFNGVTNSRDLPDMSLDPTCRPLVDHLLTQVEAQEAVIGNISKLCDVAEAFCTAQEEKMKQSVFDLPIWAHAPSELISSLCEE